MQLIAIAGGDDCADYLNTKFDSSNKDEDGNDKNLEDNSDSTGFDMPGRIKSLGKSNERMMSEKSYSILLVNVISMNVVGYLVGHSAPVCSLITDFSNENNFLLSVSKDETIRVLLILLSFYSNLYYYICKYVRFGNYIL
jgi:WD40 repeat protein